MADINEGLGISGEVDESKASLDELGHTDKDKKEEKENASLNKQPHYELADETLAGEGDLQTELEKSGLSVINLVTDISKEKCLADSKLLVFSNNPQKSKNLEEEIQQTCKKLENTIQEFGIQTQVVNVSQGPVITQYELTIEPGVHINKIVSLADNIALALAAESVRIVAPIPGKPVIGIEIPNKIREMVTLRDIVERDVFKTKKNALPIALGSSISGNPIISDLSITPHLLVAGATGSGKSVCVNSIICSLLLRCTPHQVRFLMIDPKMVELNIYNGIPHLLAPVITDPPKASAALKWAIAEMEARYRLLEKHGVRNIASYNEIAEKAEKKNDSKLGILPYIVIIIDEFADLMMVARKEIEDSVSRLAAMSRAIGIHLLLATQRPSVDVITGVIKANFPSRIAFQVSSKIDSRTIIDCMGAEKLLGKGDMLFQNVASNGPKRIQGTFLSDQEVREIVSDLRNKGEEEYILDFKDGSKSLNNFSQDHGDEIFEKAIEIAMKEGKVSTSFLQRRLRIGYNRAARIVEIMEEKGIVGASDGVKPREVLVSNF
ncbi:DNA translocase FtsK-like [Ylistrum balloti]|uniref:DNA translocase FtsK-like n=1 Tax=Ylistrum balloti TaxID=509963 RepID=UPI002905D08B|nr:DNA translocase FtsK-like [Ylistrum balloti]